jgi:hypothetical protein
MAEGEHPNCQAVERFLNALGDGISCPISHTLKINGEPIPDAYTASYMDNARGVGFTVIAWGKGFFKVVIETVGGLDRAESDGARVRRLFE